MRERIGANIVSLLLIVVSLIGLISFAAAHTMLSDNHLKHALQQGKVYDSITPTIINEQRDTTVAGLSFNDPAVRAAAYDAFSARYLQTSFEPAIDNTFAWLSGAQAEPDFTIDLREGRQTFGENIGGIIADKAETLPTCTLEQAYSFANQIGQAVRSGDGIAGLPCRPPGVTRALVEQAVARYVSSGVYQNGPIGQAQVQARDLTVNGQSFYEQSRLRQLPSLYQVGQWLPWICLFIAALLTLGIYRLTRSGHYTLLRIAISLVVAGLVTCILAVYAKPLATRLTESAVTGSSYQDITQAVVAAAAVLGGDFGHWLQWTGVASILAGAAFIILIQWQTWQRLPAKRPGHKPGTV